MDLNGPKFLFARSSGWAHQFAHSPRKLRHRLLIGHEGVEPTAQLLTRILFILESVARIDLLKIDLGKPLQTRNHQCRFGELLDRNAEKFRKR